MDNSVVDGLIALPTRLEGEQVKRLFDDLVESRRINDLLRAEVNTLKQNECAANARLEHLEENQVILFGIISKLRTEKELQPAQQDRSEILLALLRDNGGKMFAKDARRKMGLGKATFSVLIKSMKDDIEKKPYHLNRSQLIISLR